MFQVTEGITEQIQFNHQNQYLVDDFKDPEDTEVVIPNENLEPLNPNGYMYVCLPLFPHFNVNC